MHQISIVENPASIHILVADLISPSTKSRQCTRFDNRSRYFLLVTCLIYFKMTYRLSLKKFMHRNITIYRQNVWIGKIWCLARLGPRPVIILVIIISPDMHQISTVENPASVHFIISVTLVIIFPDMHQISTVENPASVHIIISVIIISADMHQISTVENPASVHFIVSVTLVIYFPRHAPDQHSGESGLSTHYYIGYNYFTRYAPDQHSKGETITRVNGNRFVYCW